MRKWLTVGLVTVICVVLSFEIVYIVDKVNDQNDGDKEELTLDYLESGVLTSTEYPFVIDLSKYNIKEVYTDKQLRDMVEVYKVDSDKWTKVEFIFKINGSKVEITPRTKFHVTDRYEVKFKIRNDENKDINLRVPVYLGTHEYQSVLNEYSFKTEIESVGGRLSSFDENEHRLIGYESSVGTERFGIHIGDMRSSVTNKYGEALDSIKKRDMNYRLHTNGEYGMYRINDYYVTFFYDTYEDSRVRAIYWVRADVEAYKTKFYGDPSEELQEGFEDVMVSLINDTRKRKGLSSLKYDRGLNKIARLHSRDMIEKNYFDHVNKEGLKALDRMENGGYKGRMVLAGENLAYGQMNSVYAHEGLMNSEGHRKNILRDEYTHVGVGVEFTDKGVPYWTVLFYQEFKDVD